MSEENVESVRKGFEDFNRGDLDAMMDAADEDIIVRPAEGWPERVVRGKQAMRSFYEAFAEAVGHHAVIDDLIDAGDRIVVQARSHLTGEHSGIETDMRYSQVFTFRKGKLILIEHFWDHREALEAAGVSE